MVENAPTEFDALLHPVRTTVNNISRDGPGPQQTRNSGSLGTAQLMELFGSNKFAWVARRFEELVNTTPQDPDHLQMVNFLNIYYSMSFMRTGTLADRERVVRYGQEILDAIPKTHQERTQQLIHMSFVSAQRFERSGEASDVQMAIAMAEEALAGISPGDPARAAGLHTLAFFYQILFGMSGSLIDLDRAIERGEEALGHALADLDRGAISWNLGKSLYCRFLRSGVRKDLDRAIESGRSALSLPATSNRQQSCRLTDLSIHLATRAEYFETLADLEEAIVHLCHALDICAPYPGVRSTMVHHLSLYYCQRFNMLGDLRDIEQAIELGQEALATIGHAADSHRIRVLDILAGCFTARFNRFGALADLDQAIRYSEQGSPTLVTCPGTPNALTGLAQNLITRFHRSGNLDDIERAFQLAQSFVASAAVDHPRKGTALDILARCLAVRYGRLGVRADLEDAILHGQQALVAAPPPHPHRVRYLINLSLSLKIRFKSSNSPDDLQQAIRFCNEALELSPPGRSARNVIVLLLAAILGERSLDPGAAEPCDASSSLSYSLEAWRCPHSPPVYRISAARLFAGMIFSSSPPGLQEASSLLAEAVHILPLLSPRVLERDDQQEMLSRVTTLAADAAALSLLAGRSASECTTLLELGRGIIMGLTIECRNDLTSYPAEYAGLFRKFDSLRIDIDCESAGEHFSVRRVRAIRELEETAAAIREIPGFAGFRLPLQPEALMAMASEGNIIIVNCSVFSSHALVVTPSTIKALPLPGLHHGDVSLRIAAMIRGLIRGNRSSYVSRNHKHQEQLLWLWDTVVGPIFEELDLAPVDIDDPDIPRVWWIGVGPLAMAPFHAAGDHSPGSTRNTISRAISSYIPSIKALAHARQRKLELLTRADSSILLVTMPTTPGYGSIPGTTAEVDAIARVVAGRAVSLQLPSPSVADVLTKLPSFHAVHFACHGVSDAANPSNSHLLLQSHVSGTTAVDRLTARAVSHLKSTNAQIAYLSACCSADNASAKLPDEGIHVASAFQLAGFSHVLATLWATNDVACQRIAEDFYGRLFGGLETGHRAVSAAFHRAVWELRGRYSTQSIVWASFVHTGA